MSIIAVRGIPFKWSLAFVVKILNKHIKGPFEALNFQTAKNSLKICFLQLSERIDPVRAVQTINSLPMVKAVKLTAYIPDHVPDLPLAKNPRKFALKKSRRHREIEESPVQILIKSHTELMSEMQIKYPGIYDISKKINHDLIEDIAETVYTRLQEILETNDDATSSFKMTQFYRRRHPHFGDFQFILSTLHKLQDAAGVPRAQLLEQELRPGNLEPLYVVDNVPYQQVRSVCSKYSDRIIKKVSEHVEKLDTTVTEMDSEETRTRKKVREEIKKLSPYIHIMIRQIFQKHFIPERNETTRVRIYGEPFLPNKSKMVSVVSKFRPSRVVRSTRMYNLLALRVPPEHLPNIFAMDGTDVSGAKLVVRSVDVPIYTKYKIVEKMASLGDELPLDNEDMDGDQYEDWNVNE